MLAEAVGEGIEEDGVDGAAGAVHGVFDDGDDFVDGGEEVVCESCGGVVEEGEDGLSAALEADTTVAVADDGVVFRYEGFSFDYAVKARCEGLFEDGGVDWKWESGLFSMDGGV